MSCVSSRCRWHGLTMRTQLTSLAIVWVVWTTLLVHAEAALEREGEVPQPRAGFCSDAIQQRKNS
jgi:hypothetical protein